MDMTELKTKYAAKIAEAKSLVTTDPQKASAVLGDADVIKAQIDLADRVGKGEEYLSEPAGTKAAQWREAAPGEGDLPVDRQAWRTVEFKTVTGEPRTWRYFVPLVAEKKGYGSAFEAYLRKGLSQLGPVDRKALSEGLDTAGGYTVPEEVMAGLLKKLATAATVRQYARIIQTSTNLVNLPRVKYTTNNEYTSGVRITWTGETPSSATAHRVTDQVYGNIAIPVNTCMASQLVSNDLIEDSSFDILGESSVLFGEAFALGENAVFWSGHGAGQPRGILTDLADTTDWDANMSVVQTANTIAREDVIAVAYALPAQYERNARWFMTKGTEKLVRSIDDTSGMYQWPIVSQVGGFGTVGPELLGFPVVRDEFIDEISDSTNTTTYPMLLADLMGYAIVDRVGISIQRLSEIYSETNQTLLLGRKRVGGSLVEAYKMSVLRSVNSS